MSPENPLESGRAGITDGCSRDMDFDETDLIKQFEELKREKMFDPVRRWKAIQEMITWIEQNMPPHLRRNRPRTNPANQPSTKK